MSIVEATYTAAAATFPGPVVAPKRNRRQPLRNKDFIPTADVDLSTMSDEEIVYLCSPSSRPRMDNEDFQ